MQVLLLGDHGDSAQNYWDHVDYQLLYLPLLLLVGETLPVAGPRVRGILHQPEPTEEPLRVGNDALAL